MTPDQEQDPLVVKVFETDEVFEMDEAEPDMDYDLGDDEQADEVREYERSIANPPRNLVIGYHKDDGRQGITADLDQSWTKRRRREEQRAEDDRPAELAAMEVVNEPRD